jgi:hypothetical protein
MSENAFNLTDYGFEKVGTWYSDINGTNFKLNKYEKDKVIYAFVMDNEVKYIGIAESKGGLLGRLKLYKKPGPTQETNKKILEKIKESLKTHDEIEIFALKPVNVKYVNSDIEINVIKGIEYPLIKKFHTKETGWNIKGV